MIKSFSQLTDNLLMQQRRTRIVIVNPNDVNTIEASLRMHAEGLAELILVGEYVPEAYTELLSAQLAESGASPKFSQWSSQSSSRHAGIEFVRVSSNEEAAAVAVSLIHEERGDVIMKGLINTDILLRAVLDRAGGLLRPGAVLSHVAVMQLPGRERLTFFTDSAVIPEPDMEQRIGIVSNLCHVMRCFEIEMPHIALIHFSEKVSERYPVTQQYMELMQIADAGRWSDVVLGGPMDVGTACDPVSGKIKGITSPVCGRADALVFPCLESANAFYKTVSIVVKAEMAGMLVGTSCPIILPSRADSADTKYNCLAMAAQVCGYNYKLK